MKVRLLTKNAFFGMDNLNFDTIFEAEYHCENSNMIIITGEQLESAGATDFIRDDYEMNRWAFAPSEYEIVEK